MSSYNFNVTRHSYWKAHCDGFSGEF